MLIILYVFLLLVSAGLIWLGYLYKEDPEGTRPTTLKTPLGKIVDRESYQKWEGRFYFIFGFMIILMIISAEVITYFEIDPRLMRFWIAMIVILPISKIIVLTRFIDLKWKFKK